MCLAYLTYLASYSVKIYILFVLELICFFIHFYLDCHFIDAINSNADFEITVKNFFIRKL